MQHQITARHCEVPDELRSRAVEIVERLATMTDRPIESTIIFDVEGQLQTVEIRMHVSRGDVFVAHGEADTHRSALDRAEEKLRKQIEKVFNSGRSSRKSIPQIET